MERQEDERLQELKSRGIQPYSISRLDTINHCLYEAYRTYRLHDRGRDNVYTSLGSAVHDVLEGITNGENTEDDLLPAVYKELDDLDLIGLEFPKDRNGGDSIRQGWIADMEHFCKTYKAPKGNLIAEELFVYKTPKGRYLIGYIDLQQVNNDGTVSIYDYKTSSLYSKADMKSHGRQLVTYLLGKEQEGKKIKRVAWIFLKYCEVRFLGKKTTKSKTDTEISKVIERKKLALEMSPYVEGALANEGYDEIEIEIYLHDFKQSNSFDVLPDIIKQRYKLLPYVCYYEVTDEIKQECIEYIDSTIDMWESLGEDVKKYPPKNFTKTQKNGKVVGDYFYCTTLCSHFNNCPYIHDYLETLNTEKEDEDDLF